MKPVVTSRLRFRTGDVFPSGSTSARWLVTLATGLNDVVLVNRWLLDGLDGGAPSHENLYRVRLSAMHVLELATYLHDTVADSEIATFTQSLPAEAQADLEIVLGLFVKGHSFRPQLEAARHAFAHYVELGRKPVRTALAELDDEDSEVVIGTTGEFRADYADKVALRLFFAGGDEKAFRTFVATLSEFTAVLMRFVETAVGAHFARQPKGTLTPVDGPSE